ncbi:unnamed protein product [Ostreobium quekettii]|uniref:Uncharacterized protein n=1 Tax=Ostreobium quekettii TaxID=121088 RepID=A0A8S1IP77_9CHLO|nr:unnamed protein product [Ostreobium quekettii]|eukprot:evm.model.scf_280EXC.5 EVM.evm.TU.scf_280EXC.5   scf_280EXC:19661-24356(-)
MLITRRQVAPRLLVGLILRLLVGDALALSGASTPPPGNAFLLSFGANTGAIRTLIGGAPVTGSLKPRETYALEFAVQEVNGVIPDVALAVEAVDGSGDVDLRCKPLGRPEEGDGGGQRGGWASNHTSGRDYIFISSARRDFSVLSITVGGGARTVRGAAFSCSVVAPHVAEAEDGTIKFELSMVVDYTPRRLVADERQALSSIFDKCCRSVVDCTPWRRWQGDLCHLDDNVCDGDGRLLRLSMPGYGLRCDFPSQEISNLSRLEKLELGWNAIRGDIHKIVKELTSAPAIEHLGLSNNAIMSARRVGAADLMEACSTLRTGNLSFLDLRDNKIEDILSPCMFSPDSMLAVLHVDGNPLNGTHLPDTFSSQSKIRVLTASKAGISGSIPNSVADAHLRCLDLSVNNIDGNIPEALGGSPVLEWVNLGRNKLQGAVPAALATSKTLRVLWLHRNTLSALPQEWIDGPEASKALMDVILARNQIQGPFPLALAQASSLLRLHIGRNFMGGRLPEEEGLFPRAAYVDVSKNVFVGQFPYKWGTIGMFAGLNGTGARLAWVNKANNETLVPVLDFSDNGISGVVNRYLVVAHDGGHAVVYLDGNKDMLCSHITGVPCDKYFNSGVNLLGQAAEMVPERLDLMYYATTMADQPDSAPAGAVGGQPRAGGGATSTGNVSLAIALVASTAMVLSVAAGLLFWRIKSRRASADGGGWKVSSARSTKDSPTPRATPRLTPRQIEEWPIPKIPGDMSSSSFSNAPSVLSGRQSMTGQAASPALTSTGSLPGSRAGGVVPPLRGVPTASPGLPPLRLPQGSPFFMPADGADNAEEWTPIDIGLSPVSRGTSPAGSSSSDESVVPPLSDRPGVGRHSIASSAALAQPLSGRSAASWNGEGARGSSSSTNGKASVGKSSTGSKRSAVGSPSFQSWLRWGAMAMADSQMSWFMGTPRSENGPGSPDKPDSPRDGLKSM